jgi:C1A family cysteine protease
MSNQNRYSLGWERDLPDFRDYSDESNEITEIISKSTKLKAVRKALPGSADLRSKCSPIENQGSLGACTAHAGVGLMEYYQRHALGNYLDGSRRFLYKTTRNLLGWTGDDGGYLRTTMKAMALFGICPEQFWPYDIEKYNDEPTAFCYAFAQSYQAIKYYRLDPIGQSADKTLQNVKEKLAAQLPSMFGFTVYSSISFENGMPDIPFPSKNDRVEGGHAVVAIGYDDKRKIGKYTGALLIRNSWGEQWGDKGYGWLPYQYVLSGLAVDFWSLVKAEFVESELFE